jgi:hypothetical protein
VKSEATEGFVQELDAKAFAKSTPSRARRSIVGEVARSYP